MFPCKNCARLETRIDKLLADAHEERKLNRESVDKERAEWAKERATLLSRIQGWTPGGEEPNPKEIAQSRGTHQAETIDGIHSLEELHALGLEWNDEGQFYYDMRLNPPVVYETVEDCQDVRAFLRAKGFSESAHPALISDEGMEAMVAAAKNFRKDESAKEEDPEHAVRQE